MESLLPSYDDPIFSILLLIFLSFLISIITYGWNLYKSDQEKKRLIKFLEKFDVKNVSFDIDKLNYDPILKEPLIALAKSFAKRGNYSDSLKIYKYLIKHTKDSTLLKEIGDLYLNAGFLKRAQDIYLEILSKEPRRKDILYSLELIYERLYDFENAKDVIRVLSNLKEDTKELALAVRFLEIKTSLESIDKKSQKMLSLLKENNLNLYRYILEWLFKNNPHLAWKEFKVERFNEVIDILWNLSNSQISLDIILRNDILKRLYFIKGYIKEGSNRKSGNFYIDLLYSAKVANEDSADLEFSYFCPKCKLHFPIASLRCPNCHNIGMKVEVKIEQKREKSDQTLL
ncbi:MAG: hypothetical protein GXO02_02955 [Epsilonproteobacteria bacterium]|nr:hypothetical protein [Campylobacterota bacterium]